jgi:hypothetical protein
MPSGHTAKAPSEGLPSTCSERALRWGVATVLQRRGTASRKRRAVDSSRGALRQRRASTTRVTWPNRSRTHSAIAARPVFCRARVRAKACDWSTSWTDGDRGATGLLPVVPVQAERSYEPSCRRYTARYAPWAAGSFAVAIPARQHGATARHARVSDRQRHGRGGAPPRGVRAVCPALPSHRIAPRGDECHQLHSRPTGACARGSPHDRDPSMRNTRWSKNSTELPHDFAPDGCPSRSVQATHMV